MPSQQLKTGLLIAACCFLTGLATRRFVLATVDPECSAAAGIYLHKGTFEEFLRTRALTDSEQVNGDSLPSSLRRIGVVNIYRNGRFVYFVMSPTGFLADSGTQEFIYQLDQNGSAIEDILRTTKRNTYHIQYSSAAPGWYYWLHN